MRLQERERKILLFGGVAVLLMLVYWGVTARDEAVTVVAPTNSLELAEKRLLMARETAAGVAGWEERLKQVHAALEEREKRLLGGETAAQAQEQMVEIVRRIARAQTPPIELRSMEIGQVRPLGEAYGEALITVSFQCPIEQVLNLLAELTAQERLIATSELRINATNPREKRVGVRLTLAGAIPRNLVPERKGAAR